MKPSPGEFLGGVDAELAAAGDFADGVLEASIPACSIPREPDHFKSLALRMA